MTSSQSKILVFDEIDGGLGWEYSLAHGGSVGGSTCEPINGRHADQLVDSILPTFQTEFRKQTNLKVGFRVRAGAEPA